MSDTYIARGRPPYTIRLGSAERAVIAAAAALRGETAAAYIRRTVLEAARRDIAGSAGGPRADAPLEG